MSHSSKCSGGHDVLLDLFSLRVPVMCDAKTRSYQYSSMHIAVTHNICGHNSCTQLVLYYYDQVRPTRKKLANPGSVRKIFSCEYLVLIIQYLLPLHLSITITITDNLAVGTQLCQASLSMLCHTDISTNKKFVSTNSLLFKIYIVSLILFEYKCSSYRKKRSFCYSS